MGSVELSHGILYCTLLFGEVLRDPTPKMPRLAQKTAAKVGMGKGWPQNMDFLDIPGCTPFTEGTLLDALLHFWDSRRLELVETSMPHLELHEQELLKQELLG